MTKTPNAAGQAERGKLLLLQLQALAAVRYSAVAAAVMAETITQPRRSLQRALVARAIRM